jgi:hypothetical protein
VGEEQDDRSDIDSAGVYFISVDDFEWRPKKRAAADPKHAQDDPAESAPDADADDAEAGGDAKGAGDAQGD